MSETNNQQPIIKLTKVENQLDINAKELQVKVIYLNRMGLNFLSKNQFNQAIESLRQAEQSLIPQLKLDENNIKLNKLAGITYNNLACYYKKCKKPKVALIYLHRALELQIYKILDWVSAASTHLNICAIYSYTKKHQQAFEHAALSLQFLSNFKQTNDERQKQSISLKQCRSLNNINMLAHYNCAIELEHLRRFQESKGHYQTTIKFADLDSNKNDNILKASYAAITRIQIELQNNRQKLLDLFARKKYNELNGNYFSMEKNIKNSTFLKQKNRENITRIQKIKTRYDSQASIRIMSKQKISQQKNKKQATSHYSGKIYKSVDRIRKLSPINLNTRYSNFLRTPKNLK